MLFPQKFSPTKTYVILKLVFSLLLPLLLHGIDKTFETSDWGTFQDSGATISNGIFELPSDSESWAGFWNSKSSLFPFSFPSGGQLSFSAHVPSGGTADVYFRFEKNPYPDTEPSYTTEVITVSGSLSTQYTINIPSQASNLYSSFLFYIVDKDTPVALGTVVISENGIANPFADYYNPTGVSNYTGNFTFGQNAENGNSINWKQEVNYNPYNNEIQDYVDGKVGLDSNDYLVLRIDRIGSNSYHSSRVNSSIYNGIKIGSGEKLSVEFEAQLPMAKDSDGNYVSNVPLWPALWLMGNDKLNNQWVGWPFCAEIDAMEWSPTKSPSGSASGYETQANIAYHWNGEDPSSGYNHWYADGYYDDPEIHTKFHKWRVDIYRYDDGINTNKIEIFMDDEYISGSRFYENSGWYNKEFWYPNTNKNPQLFGSGDKEYFLIMNIAMGGVYPGTSSVPSNFDHAEMVVKSVTYQVTSLERFTLDLNYDSAKISVSKTPDAADYQYNSEVLVEASPYPGYVLGNLEWLNKTIVIDENKSFSISAYPDFDDDDGDGLNNYKEAIIYNSNLNSVDSDNDMSNDYFESIAGTSLTDPSDYFNLLGSIDASGLFNLEFNSKSTRNYSISVSDDMNNWYDWKTEEGNDATHENSFDPVLENISGLDINSEKFFFKVDIEEKSLSLPTPGAP